MDEYISREAAIETLRPYKVDTFKIGFVDDTIDGFNDGIDTAISKLSAMPAADVRPVVKAHWIYHEDDFEDYYECSHCHDEYVVYESNMEWKFCPTCGAKMDGGVNDATD
jgi:hypothetical protein